MKGGKDGYLERAEDYFDDEEQLIEYTETVRKLAEYLDETIVFDQYHPLQAELSNYAPMAVKRVVEFVEMIESFEDDPIFQGDVLPRLSRQFQYAPARLELEIASFIRNPVSSVEFVDPKSSTGERQHDLLVNDVLPLEIKQLRRPDHISKQNQYFGEITNTLAKHGAPSKFKRAGEIHRPLSEAEKDEFIERIEEAVPQVEDGAVVEIRETSLGEVDYEMMIAPHEREDELEEWKKEHDIDGPLTGAAQSKDDVVRLKREIAEKVQQLPDDNSGVLLIEFDPWLSPDERMGSYISIARSLLRDIYPHDNLSSLVLLIRSSFMEADRVNIAEENLRIADFDTVSGVGWRTFITIHNKYVDDAEGKKLVDSIFSR